MGYIGAFIAKERGDIRRSHKNGTAKNGRPKITGVARIMGKRNQVTCIDIRAFAFS